MIEQHRLEEQLKGAEREARDRQTTSQVEAKYNEETKVIEKKMETFKVVGSFGRIVVAAAGLAAVVLVGREWLAPWLTSVSLVDRLWSLLAIIGAAGFIAPRHMAKQHIAVPCGGLGICRRHHIGPQIQGALQQRRHGGVVHNDLCPHCAGAGALCTCCTLWSSNGTSAGSMMIGALHNSFLVSSSFFFLLNILSLS
jgi:hypothetical protein